MGGLSAIEVRAFAPRLKINDKIELALIAGMFAIASSTNKTAAAMAVEFACKNNNTAASVIKKYK